MLGRHIGVDEAGRGPAIGPLVVSALSIPKKDRTILRKIGVDDSKKMSKKNRERVHMEILSYAESSDWIIGLVHCDASRIDEWMYKGSLNTLEVILFAEAIERVAEPGGEHELFLDACDVDAKRFGRRVAESLGNEWKGCKIHSRHKMDANDEVVAAASIISKVSRDSAIGELSRQLGVDLGSGYPSDAKTRDAIELLCKEEVLNDCIRRNWANVKKSWSRHHNRPIETRGSERSGVFQSALDKWE